MAKDKQTENQESFGMELLRTMANHNRKLIKVNIFLSIAIVLALIVIFIK